MTVRPTETTDFMFPMGTEVILSSDFIPANSDEEDMQNGEYVATITDWQYNEQESQFEYHLTFDDTCDADQDYDVSMWVMLDWVELA